RGAGRDVQVRRPAVDHDLEELVDREARLRRSVVHARDTTRAARSGENERSAGARRYSSSFPQRFLRDHVFLPSLFETMRAADQAVRKSPSSPRPGTTCSLASKRRLSGARTGSAQTPSALVTGKP